DCVGGGGELVVDVVLVEGGGVGRVVGVEVLGGSVSAAGQADRVGDRRVGVHDLLQGDRVLPPVAEVVHVGHGGSRFGQHAGQPRVLLVAAVLQIEEHVGVAGAVGGGGVHVVAAPVQRHPDDGVQGSHGAA